MNIFDLITGVLGLLCGLGGLGLSAGRRRIRLTLQRS